MSQTPRQFKRGRDTKIPQSSGPPKKVDDEAVHKELGDRIERAATTASSLEAEHDSGNINRTQSMATLNEPNGQLKTISEASLRRQLKLEDADGISSLPNSDIFKQLALMGPKKTAWEQFSSNIATAIICLATNRTFNFSKMIFEGMVKNLDSRSKFLMYPRFIQILLNKHQRLLLPHKRTYVAPTLTQKLFSNMRRVSKGYTGVNIPLFSSMLVQGPIQQGEGSTVPVESHHTPITTPSTSQPPLSSPSRVPTPPHDSPLPGGHTPGSDEGSMTLNELTVLCTPNLEFCDTHNMVAYLLKPEGSEDFQQIVDFLNTSHIKFALTKNPTIYTSLIQQFWQTASTSTLEDGELEDADGISSLPNSEIFEQLALMGVPTPPHDSPLPGGHTPGSDEGSMTLNELTVLCTQLSTKVASLEQDLKQTKKVYSNAYTKLIMRVKKLEHKVKSRQPRRRARVVISDTKEDLEDPSKQGRRIAEIDQNPSISLVQDEGTSWIQEDAGIQGRTSADTEILLDQEEPTELVGDLGSGEKGEKEISTANISVSTASATPEVSTAAENLVYIRRSAEKRKDKGKAIMKEDESVQKKTKKQLEQERLGHEEAIRLQEQINEEERQRIARDAEIAKQLQEEFDRARQEQEVVAEADQAHDIDWSDPAVLRYHALQNRSFSVAEVRKNMCMYLKNQGVTGVAIHMMIEKKYPLTQEMLLRMLSRRLEVDHESEMAYELLRFIRSQLQK
ncbi:hypothetical protein Tco_0772586 [Tanacetum coccineum]|uniref:Uncharacterized protein n=1 Tax=Tanacetum coccineum TaxID=301880 RepID=A0ABQ4ZLS3_9ASTR